MIETSETTSSCEERGKVYLGNTGSIVTWFISGVFCLHSVWQTVHFDNHQEPQPFDSQWPVSCVNAAVCIQCGKLFILTIIKNHNHLIYNGCLLCECCRVHSVWQTCHCDNRQESQRFDPQWPVSCVNAAVCIQCGKLFILTIVKNHNHLIHI